MSSGETKKRILLVDDEEVIRESLARVLKKENFEVAAVASGKAAQELFSLEPCDLVLSDIYMPGSRVSGLELLHFVKRGSAKPVPVVLMTGFATLAETKEAHESGADGFLAKPFKSEDLVKMIHSLFPAQPQAAPQEESQDHKYCKISIDDFISGRQIQFSIFVRLTAFKYLRLAHQGEDLSMERIRAFKSKGIRHLYLLEEDFKQYMHWSLGLAKAVASAPQISLEKKVNFLKHTGELVMEHLFLNGVDEDAFSDAKTAVDSTLTFLSQTEATFPLLTALNSHSDALYAHSLGVSLYSALVARKTGWHSPQTLYKISMAGLLHDIGKKEIDPAILAKTRAALTADEVKLLETHSGRGMEILSRVPNIPSDVLQVVSQHHERDAGTGYPLGLKKGKIHPLARLIAVVDEFCKFAIAIASHEPLPPAEAMTRLIALYGNSLDPVFTRALMSVFKMDPAKPSREKRRSAS